MEEIEEINAGDQEHEPSTPAQAPRLTGLRDAAIKEDVSSGRYLVAKKELTAGHCVCDVPKAYVLALHEEWLHGVCAQCHAVAEEQAHTIKCKMCERAFYCSDECKTKHLTEGALGGVPHRHTCAALRLLGPLERQQSLVKPRLVVEILARRELAVSAADKALGADVMSLSSHEPSWPDDDGGEQQREFSEWCDVLRDAIRATKWGRAMDADELSDNQLYGLLSRVDVNGFDCSASTLAPHAQGPFGSAIVASASCGTGIYLEGASFFNHSCEPNCEVTHGMPQLTVSTTIPVAAGAPLTISYIDLHHQMDVRTRQARLWHQYGFKCTCAVCLAEQEKLKPRTPPKWLGNCHRRGDHYVLAVGMYAAGVPFPMCFLFLGVYFIFWTKVFRFHL